jgi:hypothetical protein
MRGKGLPRYWALPFEILSTCTCYSPCIHAIASCIGDGSGTCHLLIAQCGHLWFLHVSGSYRTTYRVPVVPYVSFLFVHVSCYSWITCHFFNGPCIVFLLVHVAVSYSTTSHGADRPHFVFLFDNVAWRLPSTCRILIATCRVLAISHVMHWFVHVSYFYLIIWPVLVLPRGVQSIHHRSNSRSSLLHRLTT